MFILIKKKNICDKHCENIYHNNMRNADNIIDNIGIRESDIVSFWIKKISSYDGDYYYLIINRFDETTEGRLYIKLHQKYMNCDKCKKFIDYLSHINDSSIVESSIIDKLNNIENMLTYMPLIGKGYQEAENHFNNVQNN